MNPALKASPDLGQRLGKLLLMLSSTHDGERAAATVAIGKVLDGAGQDWHDLAEAVKKGFRADIKPSARRTRRRPTTPRTRSSKGPATPWQAAAAEILRKAANELTPAEVLFLRGQLYWVGPPTLRQLKWLIRLGQMHGVEVADAE